MDRLRRPFRSRAHKELCGLAGMFNREDKAAGRKPYLTLQDRREDGWRAVDAIK
jgi:hypothetical protein